MGKRKCKVCGKMIDSDKEEYQEYKGRLVHPDCFRNLVKELNANAKQKKAEKKAKITGTPTVKTKELKDGMSEEEFKEFTLLFNLVYKLLLLFTFFTDC